jgi:hypothetical protein
MSTLERQTRQRESIFESSIRIKSPQIFARTNGTRKAIEEALIAKNLNHHLGGRLRQL